MEIGLGHCEFWSHLILFEIEICISEDSPKFENLVKFVVGWQSSCKRKHAQMNFG